MRAIDDVEQRWSLLFNTSIGVDLRQAIRDDSGFDPCEAGLRSVCWRAFLLYGPLSKGSWTKKLAESRSAYVSLRDHFLKYINNPNDLHSSTDPLADDTASPWSSLRQDETNREEIFQDVTRCMQDNYFFREPTTQKKLLDILFIYSKLNPDTGYRQGMHELLAPIVWVINQDAVDTKRVPEDMKTKEGVDLMLEILDEKFIEHDAFSLFCALMQTAKGFYEMGESKDSATIVAQSNRIHNELLTAVDPDLAHHLQVIGVLPQIYSIRWIRLLFGREFDFKDVLKVWDLLFAENLTLDVIDMTCVAMLLRVHWQLVDADYSIAITSLTRFELPKAKEGPRSLVKDAIFLSRNRTLEAGASIIQHYSGQRPKYSASNEERPYSPIPQYHRQAPKRWAQQQSSPSRSPARFSTPQKQLENIFQEVSGNLQKRTEGWSVSKAVRGAVGEVRRNMNNLQGSHSRGTSLDANSAFSADPTQVLHDRVLFLEKRNQALSKMLDGALSSLRTCRPGSAADVAKAEDIFNISLAKIQFVSVYLADAEIPIPSSDEPDDSDTAGPKDLVVLGDSQVGQSVIESQQNIVHEDTPDSKAGPADPTSSLDTRGESQIVEDRQKRSNAGSTYVRPSLADSSFSFMLGENQHRSGFVSSVTSLPEQRRGSDAQARPVKSLPKEPRSKVERGENRAENDGFTLNSFG